MTDVLLSELPPPFHFRTFCICAIYPSGRGCLRRPRARGRRRRHGGSRNRERGPPSGDDGDGPLRSGNPLLGRHR